MASRLTDALRASAVTLLLVAPLAAQQPAAVTLTFADAVARAGGTAPPVALAGYRSDEARARLRQARGAFLPTFSATAYWLNRDFNPKSIGISFPGFPP